LITHHHIGKSLKLFAREFIVHTLSDYLFNRTSKKFNTWQFHYLYGKFISLRKTKADLEIEKTITYKYRLMLGLEVKIKQYIPRDEFRIRDMLLLKRFCYFFVTMCETNIFKKIFIAIGFELDPKEPPIRIDYGEKRPYEYNDKVQIQNREIALVTPYYALDWLPGIFSSRYVMMRNIKLMPKSRNKRTKHIVNTYSTVFHNLQELPDILFLNTLHGRGHVVYREATKLRIPVISLLNNDIFPYNTLLRLFGNDYHPLAIAFFTLTLKKCLDFGDHLRCQLHDRIFSGTRLDLSKVYKELEDKKDLSFLCIPTKQLEEINAKKRKVRFHTFINILVTLRSFYANKNFIHKRKKVLPLRFLSNQKFNSQVTKTTTSNILFRAINMLVRLFYQNIEYLNSILFASKSAQKGVRMLRRLRKISKWGINIAKYKAKERRRRRSLLISANNYLSMVEFKQNKILSSHYTKLLLNLRRKISYALCQIHFEASYHYHRNIIYFTKGAWWRSIRKRRKRIINKLRKIFRPSTLQSKKNYESFNLLLSKVPIKNRLSYILEKDVAQTFLEFSKKKTNRFKSQYTCSLLFSVIRLFSYISVTKKKHAKKKNKHKAI
jgi:hypothetical protein